VRDETASGAKGYGVVGMIGSTAMALEAKIHPEKKSFGRQVMDNAILNVSPQSQPEGPIVCRSVSLVGFELLTAAAAVSK
jgi:hypothetical protein